MYRPVFQTGKPMGTGSLRSSRLAAQWLTSTAASVGPYRLCSAESMRAWKRSRIWAGRASPLQNTACIRSPSLPGSSRKAASIDGTKCTTSTRSRRIRAASACGSLCTSGSATTSVPPHSIGRNSSHTETSKV